MPHYDDDNPGHMTYIGSGRLSTENTKTRDGSAYLKTADAHSVASAVKQDGSFAFLLGGLVDHEIAGIAARVINELSTENLSLWAFFQHGVGHDDSYESVTFRVSEDSKERQMAISVIERVIKFKSIITSNREPEVRRGPAVPTRVAEALCALLNYKEGETHVINVRKASEGYEREVCGNFPGGYAMCTVLELYGDGKRMRCRYTKGEPGEPDYVRRSFFAKHALGTVCEADVTDPLAFMAGGSLY
jgi:hypothetical protein